jgi:two-component system response regulator CpxR
MIDPPSPAERTRPSPRRACGPRSSLTEEWEVAILTDDAETPDASLQGQAMGTRRETRKDAAEPGPAILLIDDDVELCELMQEFFARRGMQLEAVHDGRRGLSRALGGTHDLLLIDVMMPGLDGFELLRLLRRQSQVPVILLTARTAQVDRVAGLDAGADDYLPKPFGPEELLARIRAVLRRVGRAPRVSDVLDAHEVRLAPSAREVWCGGEPVLVTTIEFDILEYLVRSAGRIVSRDELTRALYRRSASPFDRALDVHVSHLRKKLGAHGGLIRTVRGVGYLFPSDESRGEVS